MDSSLRVMQIISNLEIGGAQEVVRTLAENLSKAGCVLVVCTFKDGPLRAEIERLGIPVEVLPERCNSIIALPAFIREIFQLRKALMQIVKKHNIEVIQTHLLRSMDFLVLSLLLNSGVKVFWTFHNSLFDLREDHLKQHKWLLKPKRLSHHLLYRLGSHWVNGLIAVSADVKSSILETINGIPAEKISVILNSVDLSRYGDKVNRDSLRQSLGFDANDHLIALVATLKTQKGHKFLIEAAAALIPKLPSLHFLFIGDGELGDMLRDQTCELNLDRNIHFLGMRSDIPDLLAASDTFVLPSLWEGLPMALIEAMASSLPIIATDVSGTRQVMLPGETGILVAPGDTQELIQAIDYLLTNPDQAHTMGVAARRRVETQFSAQKQAREYVSLFETAQANTILRLVT